LYLITNPHITILHTYELSDRIIKFETGIDDATLQLAKKKFQNDRKFLFKDTYVHIINADRYQKYIGEKNDVAKESLRRLIPKSVSSYFKGLSDTPIYTPIDTQSIGSRNKKPEIRNQKSEYSENFIKFYELYPRKIGKQKAYLAFKKVEEEFEDIMEGLERHEFTDDPKFIPHPTTWLNGRRWEDEGNVIRRVKKREMTEEELLKSVGL
jgi:hypothetical protein